MRLTVYEQSLLPVHTTADEERGFIDVPMAEALLELGESVGSKVASWHDRHALHLHQYVGMLRVGDLQVEVLPKLDGLSEPAMVRRNLIAMLAETRDLKIQDSETVGFLETSETFISALARLYCRRLLEAVRRGLRQDYVLHQDQLPHLRGKLDWAAHVKLQTAQRLEFPCVFDDRSEDTPLNRVLKSALLAISPLLATPRTASMVTELRHTLDAIAEAVPPPHALSRLQTDRMNRHLEPLLSLAKLILGSQNPDQGHKVQTGRSTYGLIWDMNVLFEEYVGRIATKAVEPAGLRVDLQNSARHLATETQHQKPTFLLKPDILIQQGRTPVVVADTKWKRLDPTAKDLGVSEADVYQMLAYAHCYEVERVFLLYPHHPALGTPGIKRVFEIQGKIHLGVLTLDLSRLDGIPTTLAEVLTAASPRPATWISSSRGARSCSP